MRNYKFELRRTATVAQVVAFYRKAMDRNGLTTVSETESQNRSYALEARSADRMHQVYLNVLGGPTDTSVTLLDHYTLPRDRE
jgi:hypothetical protein